MAALTEARDTPKRNGALLSVPVKAATRVFQGSLVVADAGLAAPGRAAAGLVALGRAQATADNSVGAAGAVRVEIERGVFRFDNSSADAVTQAELMKDCFIADDQTVQKTGGASVSKAGKVVAVDGDGVWVEVL